VFEVVRNDLALAAHSAATRSTPEALRARCADLAAFKAALHEARARALTGGPPRAAKG